jgi:type IV secretion system protein VirB1
MGYTAAALFSLASHCAPTVAPETIVAIIRTESRGDPLALNVNGTRQPVKQTNETDAIATARRYVDAGYSVDMGLGQINSRNMRKLGLTWETAFDPCVNVAALGQILTQNYNAVKAGREPQSALRLALSMYNTGSTSRGFRNGYVGKVVSNAGIVDGSQPDQVISQVSSSPDIDVRDVIVAENAARDARPIRPSPPPAWNVFERAAYDRQSKILAETERTSL